MYIMIVLHVNMYAMLGFVYNMLKNNCLAIKFSHLHIFFYQLYITAVKEHMLCRYLSIETN